MFQQALRFIDENGRPIRYDWDENDRLIREIDDD
jgi:YD repeat-containing protein